MTSSVAEAGASVRSLHVGWRQQAVHTWRWRHFTENSTCVPRRPPLLFLGLHILWEPSHRIRSALTQRVAVSDALPLEAPPQLFSV